MTCTLNPAGTLTKELHCDSDEADRNDGCMELVRQ
jgi:hypothetical protein